MSPEEKRDDDIFEVEDVDESAPPQEFKRPKWLLDLEKKKTAEAIELKSGAAGAKPPPLTPRAGEAPLPKALPRGASASPTPKGAEVRTEKPVARPANKVLEALSAALSKTEVRKHKAEPAANVPPLETPGEFDVKIDQTKAARPALQPIEGPVDVKMDQSKQVRPALKPLEGPVEIVKQVAEAKPKPPPLAPVAGDLQIVKDVHAKTPHSERLKVTKPRKLIGVIDTTFARFNMGDAAEDELRRLGGDYDVMRRTVPGIKDLAVECKILIEEEDCDIVVACGMVGGQPIDKQCAHEASMAIQWAMLATNRHILEVFVHEEEAKDDGQLAWLMDRRTREHAVNAHWMVQDPKKLRESAGMGLRQGFDDAGPVRPG